MPIPESSLSVAIQSTADFLASKFGEDVVVMVDSPQKAQEQAKDSTEHVLNLFVYRIAPSGFHADMGDDQAFFIRANLLLTAFPAGQGNPPEDSDLRVLGQAVRVLQSFPVIPGTLPGPAPGNAPAHDFRRAQTTDYQLQAVFQAPTMEELNHIWTTQGGELAYRISAAYELALIPIEPLTHATPAPEVTAGEFVAAPGTMGRPFQMFHQGGRLFSHLDIAAGTTTTGLSLTGVPQSRVAVVVEWTRVGGPTERQPPQVFEIQTPDVDLPAARVDLNLTAAADGDTATVITTLIGPDGGAIPGAPPANPIQLNVGG
ncbi:DUF4255 domain-containing protein [Rhodobacteraceae bacterium F11138]|nr:DUF4255 domain-containing protein [Rhodobacteraceae bacterium F11138]